MILLYFLSNDDLLKTNSLIKVESPVILYDHNQEVLVMSKFRPCFHSEKSHYCTCSLYIRVNNADPHFAFIDICNEDDDAIENLKFRFFKDPSIKDYPPLNCNKKINDPDNENEWKNIPISFNYFKCAKLESECNKYMVIIYSIS